MFEVIKSIRSQYHSVEIRKHSLFGHQLLLDGDLQISECDDAYHCALVSPLIGRLPYQANVVILGGGDGGVLNYLLHCHNEGYLDLAQATLIDIDAQVLELCKTHLSKLNHLIFDHPQAKIEIGDAFAFLDKQPKQSFDAIIYDLTMQPISQEESQHTFLEKTLVSIQEHLAPNGILALQCCGLSESDPHLAQLANSTLHYTQAICHKLFKKISLQQVRIPSFEMDWIFLSANLQNHNIPISN